MSTLFPHAILMEVSQRCLLCLLFYELLCALATTYVKLPVAEMKPRVSGWKSCLVVKAHWDERQSTAWKVTSRRLNIPDLLQFHALLKHHEVAHNACLSRSVVEVTRLPLKIPSNHKTTLFDQCFQYPGNLLNCLIHHAYPPFPLRVTKNELITTTWSLCFSCKVNTTLQFIYHGFQWIWNKAMPFQRRSKDLLNGRFEYQIQCQKSVSGITALIILH